MRLASWMLLLGSAVLSLSGCKKKARGAGATASPSASATPVAPAVSPSAAVSPAASPAAAGCPDATALKTLLANGWKVAAADLDDEPACAAGKFPTAGYVVATSL